MRRVNCIRNGVFKTVLLSQPSVCCNCLFGAARFLFLVEPPVPPVGECEGSEQKSRGVLKNIWGGQESPRGRGRGILCSRRFQEIIQ